MISKDAKDERGGSEKPSPIPTIKVPLRGGMHLQQKKSGSDIKKKKKKKKKKERKKREETR